jgi:UDP-2,3-diacylglucosamine hydrolase
VILIVSDLHLGKGPPAADGAMSDMAKTNGAKTNGQKTNTPTTDPRSVNDDQSLVDLLECIRSIGPELKEVVFLGDTFDAFIEYKSSIPDSVTKWVRTVAEIQQRNIKVRFFAGNHDRWHGDYIRNALSIDVRRKPQIVSAKDKNIWMEHGDSAAPNSGLVRFIRHISDQAWVLILYKLVLPFGLGQQLAAFVSRNFSNFDPDPMTIQGLKTYAFDLLTKERVDLVVMGHCHNASLDKVEVSDGTKPLGSAQSDSSKNALYANTGDWYESRTFLLISDSVQLCRWTSKDLTVLQQEIF